MLRGIDYAWAGGRQINAANLPDGLLSLGSGRLLGVPYLAAITVVVVAAAAYALRSFRSGRELYAIGSNPDAALLAGIAVGRRVLAAFVASGAVAGLAGALWTARSGTVDATAGTGFELQVIAAVLLGGVSIFGGRGTLGGVVAAVFLLGGVRNALILNDVSNDTLNVVTGLLLISSVVAPSAARAAARALRPRRAPPEASAEPAGGR